MRKVWTIAGVGALAACAATMVAAQDGEAAPTVSRSYEVGGFEEVSVVGPHHVVISVGPAYSVSLAGPQQTLDDTEVEVEDGRLKIRPIDDDRWERRCGGRDEWDCRSRYEPATIRVTLPRLAAVAFVGGGDMRVDRIEGERFSASLAGSGELDLAVLRVDDARFSIAGSGDLVARGSARRSQVSIAGSGNLRAREVTSGEASVSIAGSGNAALTVEGDARVSIVGSGDVEISGPARCSVSRLGSGNVRCAGERVAG